MKRYVLSAPAERDLNAIVAFLIDEAGPRIARRILGDIKKAVGLVAEYPELGHVRKDLTEARLKFWTVHSYLIVYDPASKPIQIVRIFHGARDVERFL